jgi:lipoprotein NlpI
MTIELEPVYAKHFDTVERLRLHIKAGQAFRRDHRWDEAHFEFSQALSLNPDESILPLILFDYISTGIVAHCQEGDFDAAVRLRHNVAAEHEVFLQKHWSALDAVLRCALDGIPVNVSASPKPNGGK